MSVEEEEVCTLEGAIAGMEMNADVIARLAPQLREARYVACLAVSVLALLVEKAEANTELSVITRLLINRHSWLLTTPEEKGESDERD